MKNILLSVFFSMIWLVNYGQTIADARTAAVGSVVTVTGVVTNGGELGVIRYIEDATAGIAIYDSDVSYFQRGDMVTVTGTLDDYNALLEIANVTSHSVSSSGNPLPTPQLITISQFGEAYEAELVTVENVTFVDGGGTFSGNTNYDITSGGLTGEIRINTSSPLVGQIIPTSEVTLVGIMSQYSYSSPSQGYQLLLRDENDIIPEGAIALTSPVTIDNITTTSFDLVWTTDATGSTEAFYGHTPALELGTLNGSGGTTNHTLTVTGSPSELFYVKVFSVAGTDTAFSGTGAYITASNSTGDIKVYFTSTTDPTVSTGTDAVTLNDLVDDTLIAYINRAQYSIDIAIYNFSDQGISNIAAALNNAYNSGVDIRVITDGESTNFAISLLDPGIPVLPSPVATGYPSDTGIMHNKFVIFDANSSNPNDPILWTGSTNFTSQNINTDANNVIIIQDQSLALTYQVEFNEMWGSTGTTPNQTNSRFGVRKTDNTPHDFIIGGKKVECYFSPSDGVNGKIIEQIKSAEEQILVETMLITRSDIGYAIRDMVDLGVSAKVIVNSEGECYDVVINTLRSSIGNNLKEFGESGILHNKLMILDPAGNDPRVWTGCHNWSSSANDRNDENSLIVHDAVIANLYLQEFTKRFSLGVPLGLEDYNGMIESATVFPNPSYGRYQLSVDAVVNQEVGVTVSNMTGQAVKKINSYLHNGLNTLYLDLSGFDQGVYLLTMEGEKYVVRKKLILVR